MNAPGGGHSLAVFAAMLLLALLLPQRAAATYVDETYNYQVMLNGSNTIRIQVPVYDQENEDTYIDDGKLTAQWTDNNGQSHSLYASGSAPAAVSTAGTVMCPSISRPRPVAVSR